MIDKKDFAYIKDNPIIEANQMVATKNFFLEEIYDTDEIIEETVCEHWERAIRKGANKEKGMLLSQKLCSFAGHSLAYDKDIFIDDILKNGQLWYGDEIYHEPMTPNNCHSNVIKLHNEESSLPIVVGYALSKYGMWYAHTWSLDNSDSGYRVLETTKPSYLHFGIVLDGKEKELFFNNFK